MPYNNGQFLTGTPALTDTPAARVPCLMYDHVYRLGIAWQNSGYNQPPHLGYYLPDATAARFSVVSQTGNITLHYNNCKGATLQKAVLLDGTVLPVDNFILTQDEKLCTLTLTGQTAVKDISHLILQPVNPSNGLTTPVIVYVNGEAPNGIETIDNGEKIMDNVIYDLQGRKIKTINMRGIYIKNGKKYVIK